MFKEAKKDLKDGYRCDPDNKTVKKELHALVKYMTDTAKREKAAAEAAFSFHKNTTSLYEDKREDLRSKKRSVKGGGTRGTGQEKARVGR